MKNINRRKFLNSTLLGAAIPSILISCSKNTNRKEKEILNLQNNTTILFQGDSITDAGRNKEEIAPNKATTLGSGYALLASANLLKKYAGRGLKIYNKGISGNKVYQLQERWQTECVDINPNILSILIGVNDHWHSLGGGYEGTSEIYARDYEQLLKETKEKLPNTKLVICEPFALKTGAVNDSWYPNFNDYRAIAKKIAEKYKTLFVPFQTIFNEALEYAPEEYWTADGVHPTMAGAKLMAEAWLNVVTPNEFQ